MAIVPLSQVLATARTYLNDDTAQQFPDTVLIPKVQEAHRELQEELWQAGSPTVRNVTTSPLVYTTPNTALTTALPTDFLVPTAMFEAAPGSQYYGNANWVPMTEVFFLPPGQPQGPTLGVWAWSSEQLYLIGATANRAVIIQYRRLIPIPAINTDPVGVTFGESYLAARAAAMASGTLGNAPLFETLTALSKENLGKVISANRGKQTVSLRP